MTDDYFQEIIGNLQKVRRSWARLLRIIGQEGSDARKLERLYLDIVQVILIIGLKTGLVTPHIRGVVGGGSTTRWNDGLGGSNHVDERMGARITPHWRRP